MEKQVWQYINEAKHILVTSHMYPDGDALGSSLGFYTILQKMGKRVSLYNATAEQIPLNYNFLNGYTKISSKMPKFYDLIVSFDCSDFSRLGMHRNDVLLVNIDHHKSNTMFGDINIVDTKASSAGIVTYDFVKRSGIKLDKLSATALYTAIAEDTGFFAHGNIGSHTFCVAADLVEHGAKPVEIYQNIRSKNSLAKFRLLAYMYNEFELHDDAQIASIVFDKELMKYSGATRADTKNIVSLLNDLVNVRTAVMVLEEESTCKVSLRGDGSKDLSKIAAEFSGGGHVSAAGFDVANEDANCLRERLVERLIDL